ncbi:MAG TPA: choice-of-anchor L domain-containing protein [Flavobacterium sp.]|jgi:gliding motility-associated-like protein
MKKLFFLFIIVFTFKGFSQAITVNTNSYSVPQLVNNILINSPCVSATNITWSTGTNYGSSNGIGYFQNTNPSFPMQSGVMLTTGNAMNAAGPNTSLLNDGSASWVGDADLEATLAAAGIPMTSANATILEFDFTPISSHFSFEFIFASEEYGNFQCQFSDAFAFLLTNVSTGVTTNLAVVPSTTTPISVVTIRDFLYNSSCPSANAQYFGEFNGGSAGANAAINFNGQTIPMNASAVLIPDTPYHIKLVIADRTDYEADSAIFLSSESFNIGQDVLGADLTVANGTAICPGDAHTYNTGLDTSMFDITWTKDGAVIPNENGPSYTVTAPGTYEVTYDSITDTCPPVTNVVVVEYFSVMTTPNPITLYRCDSGAATYVFDLSLNTPVLMNGMHPQTQISYHSTAANANNNVNPLPLNYTSAGNQTIYVRIKNGASTCFIVKSFQLLTAPGPVANQPQDLRVCASNTTNIYGYFNIAAQTPTVLGGQSTVTNVVTYHYYAADANTGANPIGPGLFLGTNNVTIYVRVANVSDPACFVITTFKLFVSILPQVDVMENVIVCEDYVLPPLTHGNYFSAIGGGGVALFAGDVITETQTIYIYNESGTVPNCIAGSSFKVTIIDPLTLSPGSGTHCGGFMLPVLEYGDYFTQPGGNGTPLFAGNVVSNTQTVYIHYEALEAPFCVVDISFDVTIIPKPLVFDQPNVFDCTSFTLPALSVGNYYTAPNGGGTQLAAGTVITTSQTLYIYAATGVAPHICSDQDQFTITIGYSTPANISQCGPYTLPALPGTGKYFTQAGGNGTEIPAGTVIDAAQMIYVFFADNATCMGDLHFYVQISQPPVDTIDDITVCGSYTLPTLTNGAYFTGSGGTGTPLNAGYVVTTTQTIYIYSQFNAACSNESTFTVTVNTPPVIDPRGDQEPCNSFVLTQLTNGNYFTGPGGTGTMLPAGTILTTSQTVYIYAASNSTPPCTSESSFELTIFSIEADDPADVVACDSYVLPPLTIGNYYILPGGPAGGEGTMLSAGDVISDTTLLYVYTESGERINCSDENEFTITINDTPIIPAVADQFACNSYTLPALPIGKYFTAAGGTGTMLNAGDVLTTTQTVYIYAETLTTPNCSSEKSFTVTVFNVDDRADVLTCESYVLPALNVGKYYTAPGGTGTLLNAGTAITTSQTIYIYATAPFNPACSDETSLDITIIDQPIVNAIPTALVKVCDEDGENDGVTAFDLTTLTATALGAQTGTEFSIAYYESVANANAQTNPVTTTTAHTIYIRINNALAPSCFALRTINILVNKLPIPTPVGGIICFDTETQTLLGDPLTMQSGLSSSLHTFEWTNAAGDIVGTGANFTAQAPGDYTVVATKTATGCVSEPVTVTVIQSEPALITYTVTEDFADSQTITVIANGTGDYEYMLDNGVFQNSPIFNNVSSGMHLVTVHDKNGCGPDGTADALVVNYPHYFTPNGDGYNDTWNIRDLREQADSKINIYDRYGKLITQIAPHGAGWDGTYNGEMLPSTDYWFVVNYSEDGMAKEFRAHFSMKR